MSNNLNKKSLRLNAVMAVVATTLAAGGALAQVTPNREAELAGRLDKLAAELEAVKAQLTQLQKERAAQPAAATAVAPATAANTTLSNAPLAAYANAPAAGGTPATVLSSYGELTYTRPTSASENTQADLARFVLGFQHRFDDKNKVVAELEVEHAVSSSSDPGEVALEQAFVEHQLNPQVALRGGLFLIPAGLLNENHEPTVFYGVQRNFVETAIIPTTWREGGLQVVGNLDDGWTLQGGVSTGFDITKWDATSTEGAESPLGSIHQELALAKARDLSVFGAVNWRGIPGLQLGGSVFSGGASHGQPNTPSSRITLWDVHARWTPDRWDLSALYARGSISNTAALNQPLVGGLTLIPSRFDGWYTQAAYRLWSNNDYSLSPFVRYEQVNTARAYDEIGAGLTPAARPTEKIWSLGANFNIGSGIVLKADYQRFDVADDANRINLGLGWSF